ncbi:excinuclease ABC subunit C [Tenacibaculum sp. Bg11-29]|uniref:GIY-YIG nuclease family protein n=1 Tax=Tenacibaculum sp. Bg11-29 TaxID=2058306 RepID=UPI000C34B682|nr:GIY-YIG nuclease family protein [Tenacibaculum sp. Bg11-29]PKH49835.1 excinuclease ABC subunit C [Tenacibaculum sp. Bg11-29]
MKNPCIYFLTNKNNTVIYIGVTSNLIKRIYEHKTDKHKGFTYKYNCNKLVYYEAFTSITDAITREKKLKSGNRKKKENLINKENSDWLDLSKDWLFNF